MSFFLKRFLLIGITMLMGSAFAQVTQIHGRIIDSKTLEPLPFVNVFINNTTIGTSSDENGNFTLKNVPLGLQEIIYSFVGYQSYQNRTVVKADNMQPQNIKLIPLDQKLDEVEVISERDKTWGKQLRRFEKVFIGEGMTSICKIKNPWIIEFTEDPNLLSAQALQPVEIDNLYLGYRMFFYLKNFQLTSTTYSIVGDVRFEEIPPVDQTQAAQWMKNREKVYLSSIRHLTKSILDGRMRKEGYELYAEKKQDKPKSKNFAYEKAHNLVGYDTSGIVTKENENNFRIAFKDKVEVHNNLDLSKSVFYDDDSHAISWIEAKNNFIVVNKEGSLLNPKDVMISGDMTTGRVASMLPLNYVKGSIITVESGNLSAKRLQEKIYLRTDKPYYYPGEDIWISGFMSYRSPAVRDTLSKVLYVDLIDENQMVVNSLILNIDSARAMGSMKISGKIKPGNYALRSYTSWLRNYGDDAIFYKPLPVLDVYETVESNDSLLNKNTDFEIVTDKESYHRRENVKVKFQLIDLDEKSLRANFSVSAIDLSQVKQIKEELSIVTAYDLSDDLPQDRLMKFQYPIERGVSMEGIYLNSRNKPKSSGKVIIVREDFADMREVITNEKGEFSIPNLIFYDSMKFGIQVNGSVKLIQPEKKPGTLSEYPRYRNFHVVKTKSVQRKITYESDQGFILLKEVEVNSNKIQDGKGYEANYGKPDWSLKGESLEPLNPNLASAIQSKLAGYYQLTNRDNHWFLNWSRGNGEPALFIDNVQYINSGETVGDRLYSISTAMVDHVEVSSMASSQLGANGAYGVIYVFMKKADQVPSKTLSIVNLRGFDSPHVFQAPVYEGEADNNVQDDRSTLYWNPKVILSSSSTDFNFYTSDMVGKYKIIVEGVTEKGTPFRVEKIISVMN